MTGLFDPGKSGKMSLRNRIYMAPMGMMAASPPRMPITKLNVRRAEQG